MAVFTLLPVDKRLWVELKSLTVNCRPIKLLRSPEVKAISLAKVYSLYQVVLFGLLAKLDARFVP